MNILFIHNKYRQYGGEDRAVELETSILIEKGHQVRTIFFDNRSISNSFLGIPSSFRAIYNFSSARKVSKMISEFRPDIIHVHNLFLVASPSILFAAAKHKIPVVLTLHNYRLICANALLLRNYQPCELCVSSKFPLHGIRYKCYRRSASASALVTAITGVHKLFNTWKDKIHTFITLNEFSRLKFVHSSLHVAADRMITKPNFVADPGETNQPREDFYLFAGRIVIEKGVHVLAAAFARMPEENIIIIGDGPEKQELERQFISNTNICFKGHLDKQDVNKYMKRCKAFICPSIWYEGSPLTILEAFATGTPVIASKLGSMAESITDGFNGLHFTTGDADDLCTRIRLFKKETENNTSFYKNARQTYLEKYHPDKHYQAILNIYEKAIAGK